MLAILDKFFLQFFTDKNRKQEKGKKGEKRLRVILWSKSNRATKVYERTYTEASLLKKEN